MEVAGGVGVCAAPVRSAWLVFISQRKGAKTTRRRLFRRDGRAFSGGRAVAGAMVGAGGAALTAAAGRLLQQELRAADRGRRSWDELGLESCPSCGAAPVAAPRPVLISFVWYNPAPITRPHGNPPEDMCWNFGERAQIRKNSANINRSCTTEKPVPTLYFPYSLVG